MGGAKAQDSVFAKTRRLPETLRPLPFGAVRPGGWLKAQIQANLDGFTGHLDSLAPGLVVRDDIYGRDRLTKDVKRKDVGALAGGGDAVQVQYLWWNSETQSNWRDGFIRSAVLTGDKTALDRARSYVARVMATQDRDGYLGIYDKDLRYGFDGENGELWAKTTLLRGLLAWYDYTRNPAVLASVERAVTDVMTHYAPGVSKPFYSKSPDVGGLSHGLMFTDVLEALYRLTGKEAYLDYALFLYRDFSEATLHEDAQYAKLSNPAYHLQGHGVHTYEHIRAVAAAAYASGSPSLQRALQGYLSKVSAELTPSGAPAGDEWIGGRPGDATSTGYEYCSLEELSDSFTDLLGKTGNASFGDRVERLFFNAAQGARDPHASCIAYLKTDNSYAMTGGRNGDSADARQTRYKYSPVHQDVAVCCVPNAGRIAPNYVSHMWMMGANGPVATLLGPCTVKTSWKGTPIAIEEVTGYPDDFAFVFRVRTGRPAVFTLAIRKPAWAGSFVLSSGGASYTEKDGYIYITRTWGQRTDVHLELFTNGLQAQKDRNGGTYFTHGPLVLAHPIASETMVTKRYSLPGFYDYQYRPDRIVRYAYRGGQMDTTGHPYTGFGGTRYRVSLYNPDTQHEEPVWLEPIGGTILRQATFPD